ncbi:MerR family transcriptional regulator [Calidifontibacter indicus]|uniref:DNA-binding transcriptional MerR regulator n=1 Tax=Calidifontibacter indicus TaxID=419650 RepID=A0A3D9UZL5_9MICO|nr:MerR family transcriptional regulator [Calidifontibacter indicus]REF30261.1 DNA-binding transcriptional MerR regulator [Calidifontibacter indicus]
MKSSATDLSIGELAARFDLETHVLRHWEDMQLLEPARDGAGRRRYDADDVVRVAVILRNKAAGMSLEQIRVMIDADAPGRHEVLTAHIADLDRRLHEMAIAKQMAEHALRCRAHDVGTCPRFKAAVSDLLDGSSESFRSGLVAEQHIDRHTGHHDDA